MSQQRGNKRPQIADTTGPLACAIASSFLFKHRQTVMVLSAARASAAAPITSFRALLRDDWFFFFLLATTLGGSSGFATNNDSEIPVTNSVQHEHPLAQKRSCLCDRIQLGSAHGTDGISPSLSRDSTGFSSSDSNGFVLAKLLGSSTAGARGRDRGSTRSMTLHKRPPQPGPLAAHCCAMVIAGAPCCP